ncbi:oxidoreductase [Labilibacter sediminis]|nr:oxidoreductase [Labilibacter sediminis]
MKIHKVLNVRAVSKTAFILRFNREGKNFEPGLHISVGLPGDENRPYSIYNGVGKDYLEILVKEIPNGLVTPKLKRLKPGNEIKVGKPRGYFCLPDNYNGEKLCLIATGTGIAPFHSFIESYPNLNYHLYHGVKDLSEAYDLNFYNSESITLCTSRTEEGDVMGRVTKAMKNIKVDQFDYFYICGSYEMLDEVYELLEDKGVKRDKIKTEGYF